MISFVSLFDLLLWSHFGTVSYLATLYLVKPTGGILPVFSAYSIACPCQLPFLETAEEVKFSTKECAGREGFS